MRIIDWGMTAIRTAQPHLGHLLTVRMGCRGCQHAHILQVCIDRGDVVRPQPPPTSAALCAAAAGAPATLCHRRRAGLRRMSAKGLA
jgi:hypothetical protein